MYHKHIIQINRSYISYRPRGKESTEVRKSQNKGKESENLPKIEEVTVGQAHAAMFHNFSW